MEASHEDAFLDTSVVIRYLTGEPPEMAANAQQIINRARRLKITDITLMESAHVLRTQYSATREDVVDGLLDLVGKDDISVYGIDDELVIEALLMCRPSNRISIADAMIWAAARSAGSRIIYTFDQRFPDEGLELRGSL